MRIGFDAYFAFHYKTGVAHYSRNLINSIAKYYPQVELLLFVDRKKDLYQPTFPNISIKELGKDIPYHEWLSNGELHTSIRLSGVDIFHGLDHGLPSLPGIKKVVTIHDLFFESHPGLYQEEDVKYYHAVAAEACTSADAIIAISEFTRRDLFKYYGIPHDKINVCYQACNPLFFETVSAERKDELRKQFDLPPVFWLYVGSVTPRKNLFNICKAMCSARAEMRIPLIVIGEGSDYLAEVQHYIAENQLEERIRFLSYTHAAKRSLSFQQAKDIPAFYQMAHALLYPSYLEGFGIPLIEAFASGTPVITSSTTSLPEIGGDAALYVDPYDANDIASAMLQLEKDEELRRSMIRKGKEIVKDFSPATTAASVMNVYRQLI